MEAVVLLSEQKYLEKEIKDPGRYFPALIEKRVLNQAQCSDIRKQPNQLQKFLELLSVDQRGYGVFVQALRDQRVHAHVARYLKEKVLELDKLSNQGSLLIFFALLAN